MFEKIKGKIEEKTPITRDEASYLFNQLESKKLSDLAQLSKKTHGLKENHASYLIMAILNYTNICVAGCDYCAFYRFPHQKGAYLRSFEEICEKIDILMSYGGSQVAFNGGFHPHLKIKDYAELFAKIHTRYPQLSFYEMTIAEFMFACKRSKVSYSQGAQLLKAQGTEWITGGGAEILDENFRKRHSPGKFSVKDYFEAQRKVLQEGIGSTATMVIGFDESLDERLNHLESLRNFQDSLVGNRLTSFLCWVYKPYHTKFGGSELDINTYLRWLAVCRIYLHNFKHIRTSVLTKNEKALSGIHFGANDFDLPVEDEVTQTAGATISHDFDMILNSAKELGISTYKRSPFNVEAR